ncbi:MAG TPA: photosynthetic reaction center cytochrome c subunit family protein [Candidatus Angelobacter sp.]|nr:photosynthetic reaction center cytochrome c subunit family protein [Candidatus Angelobacter sp.]
MNRKLLLLLIPLVSIIVVAMSMTKKPLRPKLLIRAFSTDDSAIATAEKVFKNIQVLKGYPADQIYPTMQFINESLGVSCEYCHIINAYEKDDKKAKRTARRMMLAQRAINKEHFGGHLLITCYTCHRGALDVPQR